MKKNEIVTEFKRLRKVDLNMADTMVLTTSLMEDMAENTLRQGREIRALKKRVQKLEERNDGG